MPNDKDFELDDLEAFSFDDLSLEDSPPAVDGDQGEDPFGVWVKSAPEDIGQSTEPPAEPPQAAETLTEDDFLSSDELAELDDNFDFVTVSEAPLEGEEVTEDEGSPEGSPTTAKGDSPDFDEISLDDFVSFDDFAESSPEKPGTSSPTLSSDEPEEEVSEDFLDIDIDIEDEISDDELEIIEGAQPKDDGLLEDRGPDTFSAQEVDLSEFGDFEEVVPVQEEAPGLENLEEPGTPQAAASGDPEILPDDGFFEEMVLDEGELQDFEEPITVPLDLEPDDQTDLDHIRALEEDLTSGIRETPGPQVPASQPGTAKTTSGTSEGTGDLAAQILEKIEHELSSIKSEISELKREVTHLRASPAPARAPEPPAQEETEETAPKARGFFDEEEDETIALTGDELDNLLSTAEISEGEEAGIPVDEDLLDLDSEGNLVEPDHEPEAVHVTDEEFLAGTALDLNSPGSEDLGVPESIELEEGLPEGLGEGETEDLLSEPAEDFEIEPLPEGLLEGPPEKLEIPFDEDIGLELSGDVPADDEEEMGALPEIEDLNLDSLPPLDTPEVEADSWEAPVLDAGLDLVPDTTEAPEVSVPAPLPPAPTVDSEPVMGGDLSPTLKKELKEVLAYMDKLLASLPDEKIQEFAESEHFEVYRKLFEELGLIE